jgi:predicted component of type VI protein secretion system
VKDTHLDVAKAVAVRRAPDGMNVDVTFNHSIPPHLKLGPRRAGVARAWLGKPCNSTGLQDTSELAQDRVRIRHVMKRVEAHDAVDARVGHLDPSSVEREELRRRAVADNRHSLVELTRDSQRRRRDVKENHAAAQLGEEP